MIFSSFRTWVLISCKAPPQRELADYLDLNFTTITHAYKLCELKGLIYAVAGSGTFVAPNAARSITISTDKITDCIDLGFVASFEQTNGIVAEIIQKVADKSYLEQLLNYNDPTGIPHQKTARLNWMESFGICADQEHIAIVSGAQNALAIALTALFKPGNRIATDLYTYSNFIELAKMLHIQLVPIPGDQFGMMPNELEKQCCQTNIHGIFLMPSCCNSTTVMISDFRKHELATVIRKYHLKLRSLLSIHRAYRTDALFSTFCFLFCPLHPVKGCRAKVHFHLPNELGRIPVHNPKPKTTKSNAYCGYFM